MKRHQFSLRRTLTGVLAAAVMLTAIPLNVPAADTEILSVSDNGLQTENGSENPDPGTVNEPAQDEPSALDDTKAIEPTQNDPAAINDPEADEPAQDEPAAQDDPKTNEPAQDEPAALDDTKDNGSDEEMPDDPSLNGEEQQISDSIALNEEEES
nr:hypothetical protein [Lachnospiraceae bacterium]